MGIHHVPSVSVVVNCVKLRYVLGSIPIFSFFPAVGFSFLFTFFCCVHFFAFSVLLSIITYAFPKKPIKKKVSIFMLLAS
jgi:hypothetical protein